MRILVVCLLFMTLTGCAAMLVGGSGAKAPADTCEDGRHKENGHEC